MQYLRRQTVLAAAADKRRALMDQQRKLSQRQTDRNTLMQDEANIRSNIAVLTAGSTSRDQAVTDLTAKDNDLKQANKDIADLPKAIDKAQADLEAFLSDTNIQ